MTVPALPLLGDLGDLSGRSVLVRVDFNVPLANGGIADDLRVRAAVPTLRWLLARGASVKAITHLGRPLPVDDIGDIPSASGNAPLSVAPLQCRLAELVPGVELDENLRFHPGEIAEDAGFAAQLADGHHVYVNEAFSVSHRAHASIVGLPRLLPSAAGLLLAREIEVLERLRSSPRRPFVALLGGSKVADKLGVIRTLIGMVDTLLIGGGMCFTFLKAQGHSIGASICEDALVGKCSELLDDPAVAAKIHLPVDIASLSLEGALEASDCGSHPDADIGRTRGTGQAGREVRLTGLDLPDGWMGADIGPESAAVFSDTVLKAGTVLWNGPMGVFEDSRFASGTKAVAAAMSETQAFTVVGGGDSAAAARYFGVDGDVDHVSTGGGAALEFIEKGDLPGLAALRQSPSRRRA